MRGWVVAVLLASCSRPTVAVGPDRVDAAPTDAVVTPAPKAATHMLVGGRIVDTKARRVLHELGKDGPTFEDIDAASAFIVDRVGVVRAFDVESGKERWNVKPPKCSQFAVGETEAYCVDDTHLHAIAKSNGALRTIAGAKSILQIATVDRHVIIVRSGGILESIAEGASTGVSVPAPLHTWPRIVARKGDICGAADAVGAIFAGCWSSTLSPRWTTVVALAKPTDPKGTHFRPKIIGPDFMIFGTQWSPALRRSAVLRMSDGVEVARVEEEVGAVVSHDGVVLDGMITVGSSMRFLDAKGAIRWTAPLTVRVEDAVAATTHGSRLFVATYSSIATGASLYAFDDAGSLRWTAVPVLPPIAHSAYANDVVLSARDGVIAMRGYEAAFDYLALFDPDTGKSVLNVAQMRW